MFTENNNFREAAHIGEELFDNSGFEMDSKCMSVESTVKDGVFTLEKALKLYKVPLETYIDYLAGNHVASIDNQLKSDTKKAQMMFTINVMEKIFEITFANIDASMVTNITKILSHFSRDIEKEKVVLK
jgi:hypothetical protein